MEEGTAAASATDTNSFRAVFNASPIGIVVENLEGQPLFANPVFCSFLGFTEEELRGKHCFDFSPAEDAAKDWALFQQLRAGSIDHYQLEKRYFRRDGSTVWGRLSISLLNTRPAPLVLAMVEDITASKRLESDSERTRRLLQESEERLLLAAQAGKMFAYTWHADTDVIERSGKYDEILGVGKGEVATGAILSTMVHPDDRDRINAAVTQLTPASPNLQITYRIIRPDGKSIWLDRTSRAYFDEAGKLERIVGMVVDVTERKQAEETLREYEKAAESAEDMIGVIDREYRFLIANRQYLKMRNLAREQVVGHSISEVLGKDLFENVIKPKLDECFQGNVVSYETKFPYPAVGERDLLLSYFPIEGPNGIDRAACILRDITERKRAEEALRTSEERLRLAQWAAHIGTFDVNMRTGVDIWPPETEALYGLPPGGFGGTLTAFENLVHPDDRERISQLTQEMIRTGQPAEAEWRVVWPDGSIHWIASRGQVLMDDSGKPMRMLGVNIDVTERKVAEERLLEVNHTLKTQAALLQSREELLKIFVKNVPAGVAMLDHEMRYLEVSDRWCADYSLDSSQVLGRSHYELFSDVPDRWKQVHRRALEGEISRADEDRWDRAGGTTTWVRWEILPWKRDNGTIGGILIFAEDITRRRKMEEALADVSRKLIQAHEAERTRIARELHDDINQRIALLSVEMERWIQHVLEAGIPITEQVYRLRGQLSELGKDVQALSHRLHSSKLDYLGLTVAARSFCREFSEQHSGEIEFTESSVPTGVPRETSLALFRVLQEAVQNALKHSGVRKFKVDLQGTSTSVQLTISDLGIGFNSHDAMLQGGLGLVSMRERLQLVGGDLSIVSEQGRGTTITARAPFEHQQQEGLAAS